MKFILDKFQFESTGVSMDIDTQDIENIFIPMCDIGFKFEYEIFDKKSFSNSREVQSLGNEFGFFDSGIGCEKIKILKKVDEFLEISLTCEFPTDKIYEPKKMSKPVETDFQIQITNDIRESLSEIEDRIEDMGYDFINNTYVTEYYGDNKHLCVIHYFLFKPQDIFYNGSNIPVFLGSKMHKSKNTVKIDTDKYKSEFDFKSHDLDFGYNPFIQ